MTSTWAQCKFQISEEYRRAGESVKNNNNK